MTGLFLALLLGIVSGLRVFTAPAAVLLTRGGVWGIIVAILALVEYVVDLLPRTGSRTAPVPLLLRLVSGAFVGWMIATMHGASGIAGAIVAIIGVLIGAYGGLAVRLATIKRIGAIPSGLSEDVVAIALAAVAVTR
jgi:uncharacterized membrane protein